MHTGIAIVFAVYIVSGILATRLLAATQLLALARRPEALFWAGVALTLFWVLAGVYMMRWGHLADEFEIVGHVIVVFYSVIGGSIISRAFSELRDRESPH
ncbi:hypothetical protein CCR79_13240 [Halorhodospira halophila]|nr:hypothetical protein [Halorhodospira halophila]